MIESAYQLIREAVKASPGASVFVTTTASDPQFGQPIREVRLGKNGELMIVIDAAEPPQEPRSEEIP